MTKIIIVVLSVALLHGCATKPYMPPTTGPLAKITFIAKNNKVGGIAETWQPNYCSGKPLEIGPVAMKHPWNPLSKESFPTIDVQANVPFDFRIGFYSSIVSCGFRSRFTPENGREYEISYNWRRAVCMLAVEEIERNKNNEIIKRVPVSDILDLNSEEICNR
ncbi:hypothetical protein GYB61_08055 [bacterium]|nr:hypothetical protein [bacterium]